MIHQQDYFVTTAIKISSIILSLPTQYFKSFNVNSKNHHSTSVTKSPTVLYFHSKLT